MAGLSDNPTFQELSNMGIKAYIQKQYDTAVSALSGAIELKVAEHGEKHESLGRVYLYYGLSLLEVSRSEAEPLGDAVPRELNQDSDDDDEENESDKTDEEEKPGAEAEPAPEGDKVNGSDIKEAEPAVSSTAANGEKMSVDVENGEPEGQDKSTEEPSSSGTSAEAVGDKAAEEGDSTEDKVEEEPTDLQLAWEVLELAKLIFEQQGDEGKAQLAETLVVLGEVSLESENFESAIADIKQGLEIQKTVLKPDNRMLAETYYKLGMALATNNQVDEAIENYNMSLKVLNKRLDMLRPYAETEDDRIQQIEKVIPEIEEKIADMKSYKEETANKLATAMGLKPAPTETKLDAGSSAKQACDISHLVKRKRKLDDEPEASEEGPAKKPPSI